MYITAPEHRLFSVQHIGNINSELQLLDGGLTIQLPLVFDLL